MGAECLTADPQLYHKAPGMGKIKSYLYLPFSSEDSEGQKDDECVGRRMCSGVPSPGSSLASPSGEEGKGLLDSTSVATTAGTGFTTAQRLNLTSQLSKIFMQCKMFLTEQTSSSSKMLVSC